MGMRMVVVQLLLTIFHGLKDGFAATVTLGFPFVLLVIVLVATSVAVDDIESSHLPKANTPVDIAPPGTYGSSPQL